MVHLCLPDLGRRAVASWASVGCLGRMPPLRCATGGRAAPSHPPRRRRLQTQTPIRAEILGVPHLAPFALFAPVVAPMTKC